jgi:hypothetical protein
MLIDCIAFNIVDCDIINSAGCGILIEESTLKKRKILKDQLKVKREVSKRNSSKSNLFPIREEKMLDSSKEDIAADDVPQVSPDVLQLP